MADSSGRVKEWQRNTLEKARSLAGAGTPEFLFHYTDAKGLHGILESRSLWATRFEFLNDPTEYTFAHRLIDNFLAEVEHPFTKLLRPLLPALKTITHNQSPHFVVSTSSVGDSLSQWRGYGRVHDGYAIALKREPLAKASKMLIPIIYKLHGQERLLQWVLDTASEYIDPMLENASEEEIGHDIDSHGEIYAQARRLINEAAISLHIASYHFKDPSFSGESEWRVLSLDHKDERFRVARGHLVPYVTVPLSENSIDHIIQGPGTYRDANASAIERFALNCGFKAVSVRKSEVPLV